MYWFGRPCFPSPLCPLLLSSCIVSACFFQMQTKRSCQRLITFTRGWVYLTYSFGQQSAQTDNGKQYSLISEVQSTRAHIKPAGGKSEWTQHGHHVPLLVVILHQFDSIQRKRCLRHSKSRPFAPSKSSAKVIKLNLRRALTQPNAIYRSTSRWSLYFSDVEDGRGGGDGGVKKWLVMRPLGAGAGINTFWGHKHPKNSSLKESV